MEGLYLKYTEMMKVVASTSKEELTNTTLNLESRFCERFPTKNDEEPSIIDALGGNAP